MKLIFKFINNGQLEILIKKRNKVISDKYLTLPLAGKRKLLPALTDNAPSRAGLTAGQGSDNMLIKLLDKILLKNKMSKLSLKTIEIQGEMSKMSVLRMSLAAIGEALKTRI